MNGSRHKLPQGPSNQRILKSAMGVMRVMFSATLMLAVGCGDDTTTGNSGGEGGAAATVGTSTGGTSTGGNSSGGTTTSSGGAGGMGATTGAGGGVGGCGDIDLAPLEEDPDVGYIDITAFCVAEINTYRVMDGLEPYTVRADGLCCSAREAHQALIDGTSHNGDYCDWAAQGAAGGGRNPNGTAQASVEWVPRLFYQEKGDTFEESGGHYQAMMRTETREVACGWYAESRDNHRVVVNYW